MLKSIFTVVSAALLCAVLAAQPAQAGVILTQDLLIEDVSGELISAGSISFDLDNFFFFDSIDPGFGSLTAWNSFTLFGYEIDFDSAVIFELAFDAADVFAGLQYINFDVNDVGFTTIFAGYFELAGAGYGGYLDVLDFLSFELVDSYNGFAPGQASVVSAPATLWLFIGALGGLALRQRRINNV